MDIKKWKVTGLLCAFFMTACTEQANNSGKAVYGDEMHRPQDWAVEVKLVIGADTVPDDEEKLPVLASMVSASFEDLIDQVYYLSFSGDVPVYAPDVFGDMDRGRPLAPADLVQELEAFDTLTIEDIRTGALLDTVVNVSFNRNSTSALTVYLACYEEDGALQMSPYAISAGKQVFNESSGTMRGVANKFFVGLKSAEDIPVQAVQHRLFILSDSNGLFQPAYFSQYNEGGQKPLEDLLRKLSRPENVWQMEFRARLDYVGQRLTFEKINIIPGREELVN